jgi:NAD(P)-dependent dehydrogenase (short-subunit alcohol dehydrogenase family)
MSQPTMLITGASRGIGAAAARLAAQKGWSVCINYASHASEAENVVRTILEDGGRAVALRKDVTRENDVKTLFDKTEDLLGPVSALINNAGVSCVYGPIVDYALQDFRDVFEVNVFGLFLCSREGVRRMSTARGRRGGVIVNMSSRGALHGQLRTEVPYAASKGAVESFTYGLANEVADQGIRVVGVRPSMTLTDMYKKKEGEESLRARAQQVVPMGRPGYAEEPAAAAVWLCSDEASYITGTFIDVGGGR